MLWNCVAVDALPFLSEPLDEGGGVRDFPFCFGEGLALFESHELREIFLIGEEKIEPFAENYGALFSSFFAPCGKSAIGGFDGLARFAGAQIRDVGDDFAGGGIVDRKGFARSDPLAVDVCGLAKKIGIFELRSDGCGFCGGFRHGGAPWVVGGRS